jgi:hypothetical protein
MSVRVECIACALAACLVAVVLGSSTASAQVSAGVQVGVSGRRAVFEVMGRLPTTTLLSVGSRVQVIQSSMACPASWPESYRCGFSGWGVDVEPTLNVISAGRLEANVFGTAGVFLRTGDGFDRKRSGSWGARGEGIAWITPRFGAVVGGHHKRVGDRMHRELFGQSFETSGVSGGLRVRF